ncbi:hypothetical protein K2173_023113 [Erythroxylum novogranatense]|uniref:Uncharacterized protein n=1 Tax=Erythroxylum novogranatense TaxID=1862640 RepID=A0AAV8T9J9_9ROSI|nr:hypothetical protein K2173_023113 [Erythroxylum novogranatense]
MLLWVLYLLLDDGGLLHKKVLESITEVSDIDAIIEQAEEANRLFSLQHPAPNLPFNIPPWNAGMSVEELDANERQAFLSWRRSLARSIYKMYFGLDSELTGYALENC